MISSPHEACFIPSFVYLYPPNKCQIDHIPFRRLHEQRPFHRSLHLTPSRRSALLVRWHALARVDLVAALRTHPRARVSEIEAGPSGLAALPVYWEGRTFIGSKSFRQR